MKRDRFFILAFTCCIFLAAFCEHIIEESMWKRIVAAVTITSSLLSIADLAARLKIELEELVASFKKPIDNILRILTGMPAKLDAIFYQADGALVDSTQSLAVSINKNKENCNTVKESLIKFEKCAKWLNYADYLFVFLAFFAFFCMMVFQGFFDHFANKLDEITLSSFALILLSQVGGSFIKDFTQESSANIREVQNDCEELNDILSELKVSQNAD